MTNRSMILSIVLLVSSSVYATENAIDARTRPIGQVNIGAPRSQTVSAPEKGETGQTTTVSTGKNIYAQYCAVCHAAGVAGAPKTADATAWGPRVKQGWNQLVTNAINGIKAMPPKGTCMTCSKTDIEDAINYMLPNNLRQ